MTRFDATVPEERRTLFADGIAAHRQRDVGFLTVEVEMTSDGASEDHRTDDEEGTEASEEVSVVEPPWVQFEAGTLNLDCTDKELDRLTDLLDEYPAFTVEQLTSPENAEGTNVRVSARVDDERIAAFIEEAFLRTYERPEDYRVWVTTL